MDSIEFRMPSGASAIQVNGVRLLDLAYRAELPYATREAQDGEADFDPEELAGAYTDLTASHYWPSRHLLGEPADEPLGLRDDGETMLLICDCGFAECWALLARIELTEDTVRWSGFRNSHRDWDLSAMGPFTFSRPRYEQALRRTGPAAPAP